MKYITLRNGLKTKVDDEDYDWLNQWQWYQNHGGYVIRNARLSNPRRRKYTRMHRLVNNTPEGFHTDHINHDPLDNRRSNLRTVTVRQNRVNASKSSRNTSGYIGVSWEPRQSKWKARICWEGKEKYLGSTSDIKEAARMYNQAATKLFGEYANLNQIT